ncbi:MAG: RIP metalloprotease RseP [Verrucomicrobiales bacterium]
MNILLSIVQFIGVLLLVVMVFNVLILVHEWGHYLAARWRGLKVEKFQIWFGKRLWSKEINGVEYGLGSIPAGGFVALPQMAPMEMLEGDTDETRKHLPPIKPLDKIIVALAGPVFSFGLACVFAAIVWVVGHPVSKTANSTVIGFVAEDSPAERAGLLPGDNILEVAGQPVKTFGGMVDSVTWSIISSEGDEVLFKVVRPGAGEMEILVDKEDSGLAKAGVEGESEGWLSRVLKRPKLRKVGIGPEVSPVIVEELRENGPAIEAGVRAGDEIMAFNGAKLYNAAALEQFAAGNPGVELTLTVLRDGAPLQVVVTPRMPEKPGTIEQAEIGVRVYGTSGGPETILIHPSVRVQISNTVRTMMNTIGAVASPGSDVSLRHLSGPVGIMDLYYRLFRSPDGWRLVLWFSVLLNVNLAILNMLPLPVLDGGHITMALIEGATRRPINIKVLEFVQTACAILLIGFMLFVTVFDTGDILRRNHKEPPFREPEFLPSKSAQGESVFSLPGAAFLA